MNYAEAPLLGEEGEEEKVAGPICGVRGSPARAMCCSIVLLLAISISLAVVLALQIRINTIMTSKGPDYMGSMHIGIISDIHLDLNQNSTTCTAASPWGVNMTHYPSQFGVRGCDPSLALVNMSIQAFNKKLAEAGNTQFSLFLGDIVGHFTDGWGPTLQGLSMVCELLAKYSTVPVFPTLGNNDVPYDYSVPNNSIEWYSAVWDHFYTLIHHTTVDMRDSNTTFLANGYYCVKRESLYIVSLHTNAFSIHTNVDSDTATKQLDWLNQILTEAQASNDSVLIMGHIPPGLSLYDMVKAKGSRSTMWHDQFTRMYFTICSKHSDVIAGTFFGHHHTDSWYISRTADGLVSSINVPAISQIYEGQPSFTVAVLNYEWRILDLIYYYCPLDFFTRGDATPHFILQYSFKYNMLMKAGLGSSKWTPISSQILSDVTEKLLDLDDLMYTFNECIVNQYQYASIPPVSPYQMYCQITESMADGLDTCLRKYHYNDFYPPV